MGRSVHRPVTDRCNPRCANVIVRIGADNQHPVPPVSNPVIVDLALPYHSAPASRWPTRCWASHAFIASASSAILSNRWYRRAPSTIVVFLIDRATHADMLMPARRACLLATAMTAESRETWMVAMPIPVTVVGAASTVITWSVRTPPLHPARRTNREQRRQRRLRRHPKTADRDQSTVSTSAPLPRTHSSLRNRDLASLLRIPGRAP